MSLRDFHVHTVFSDGKNTPEEMVRSALEQGMTAIGFSDHSYTFFDESYCMPKAKIRAYREEIHRLKEKYRGQIEIYCGIEQDFYSDAPTDGYDYVIGSVHYLKIGDTYIPVDETPEILLEAAEKYFGGDIYKLAELYFETVAQTAEKTGADIIGHFDLIRKFNRGQKLFSETNPRYLAAAQAAADRLLQSGKPFEINTGAISRGYQDDPYPSAPIQTYLQTHAAPMLPASDSHSAQTLCFGFADIQAETMIEFRPE